MTQPKDDAERPAPHTGDVILVGITSWADGPCVAIGFNYRVDIPQTQTFIQDVFGGLD